MDFPPAAAPEPIRARPGSLVGFAAVALALYAVFLVRYIGAVAGGSDSSGYMNHARLLSHGSVHTGARSIAGLPEDKAPSYLYVPLGFRPAQGGTGLVPTYPSGLALFIAAAQPVAGWKYAGDLVIILHSLAGLVATYGLCRAVGLGRRWAFLGTFMVGLSPIYLFMSFQAMSDVPSLCWTTVAVLAALRAREKAGWALVAGAALAVDVLLRPTNILALVPILMAMGPSIGRWALVAAGGLPGAVFFALHSHAAYGSFLATGYGDNSESFQAFYVPMTLKHYATWLPSLFTPIVILAAALPWVWDVPARIRWLLAAWVLIFLAFYSAYNCTHEAWWYLRFLLPVAPALVAASLLVLRAVLSRGSSFVDPSRSLAALVFTLVLVGVLDGVWVKRLAVLYVGKDELRYGLVADWMKANVPADAVCMTMQASGALHYYTDFTLIRWDMIDSKSLPAVEAAIKASKKPLYAVLFPFEINDQGAFTKHVPGRWTQVGKVEGISIWKCEFDSKVL